MPGDYNGDGTTERAVYRSGAWYVEAEPTAYFGLPADIVPVTGDYDGDGTWERAVYRDGAWLVEGDATVYLGSPGDVSRCPATTTATAPGNEPSTDQRSEAGTSRVSPRPSTVCRLMCRYRATTTATAPGNEPSTDPNSVDWSSKVPRPLSSA